MSKHLCIWSSGRQTYEIQLESIDICRIKTSYNPEVSKHHKYNFRLNVNVYIVTVGLYWGELHEGGDNFGRGANEM